MWIGDHVVTMPGVSRTRSFLHTNAVSHCTAGGVVPVDPVNRILNIRESFFICSLAFFGVVLFASYQLSGPLTAFSY